VADAEVIENVSKSDGELITAGCNAGLCDGVRYDAATLREVRRVALDRFLSIPRGGLEVGGLLFGRVKDNSVEILAAEDFSIEYLTGPSFVLSERDEATLAERLQQNGPEFGGAPLNVVGWWHSHTRTDVKITAEDIRVHRKFFPQPEQLALIIKPFKLDPAQVAIYRPGDSHGESQCVTFSIGGQSQTAPVQVAEPVPEESRVITGEPLPTMTAALPARLEYRSQRRSGSPNRKVLIGFLASVMLLPALAYMFWSERPPSPPNEETPTLNLSGLGDELTIRWEDRSNRLASSRSAELIIVDGAEARRIPLSIDSLRSATLSYARHNPKVEVRLRAWTRDNELLETVAHYVGPTRPPIEVTPPPLPAPSNVEAMKAELDRLNGELLRMRKTEPPAQSISQQIVSIPAKPVFRTASVPPSRARQEVQAQPTFVPPPSIATGGLSSQIVNIPIHGGTPSLPAPPATPTPTPAAAKLSSGRAIWTGVLPRGAVLLFDGRRPSAGAITGRLPQRRSRVRVFPADLTPAGIVVYTDGSKQQVEPPGAGNGWNLTMYRADPKRSREVTVVEAPNQSNNWQKLMVRSEQRPISMLVVEWEEIP
jgi:hypothetical protein